MMMYVRIINKRDIDKFNFKNETIKQRMLQFPTMVDWRINVEDNIIVEMYLKNGIRDVNEESYYETNRCGYGKLPRFCSSNSFNILSRI